MHAIEFQTTVHDGILHITAEHQRQLDGRAVRVVVVDTQAEDAGQTETLFARLRRVRIAGPADLSTEHEASIIIPAGPDRSAQRTLPQGRDL
ncbi:hypothetical protein [uncultured Thiodictyon sp.]|uniref:hypothetical protein n=1 Tax=uncultured Thiodictyon sp. TaxID=1846217 RepID=UPI00260039E0|nr:hypothetical protein [uncultured Thiodictyon sp.]